MTENIQTSMSQDDDDSGKLPFGGLRRKSPYCRRAECAEITINVTL